MRFPFVLFDAGGTLIGPRTSFGAVYAQVLETLGWRAPAADFEAGLRAGWMEINREIPSGTNRYAWFPGGEAAYWLRFVEATFARTPGIGPNPALARRALDPLREAFADPGSWSVYPDVLPAFGRLRKIGVRTAVVSNWDSRLPRLLTALGLVEWFDTVVVSCLHGEEKPRPSIFLAALDRLGADPAEALHVGDVPELDWEGARAAGVSCVLVDRLDRLEGVYRTLPSLEGLPGVAERGLAGGEPSGS